MRRFLGGGAAAAAFAVLVLAPAAGAGPTSLSRIAAVDVVGAGPIAWPRVAVRIKPTATAPVIETLTEFRPDYRPRFALVLSRIDDRRTGKPRWYRITVPGRPNGRTGWVPAASVSAKPVDRWLVIYRESCKFELYVRGRLRRTGKIAVGARGMETPTGLFYVQAKFVPTQYPVLGAYAFETSGYSKLSDWPNGGVVGVHGTNTPELIGQAVSHGCVRLYNEDIQFLRSAMPVGTPIKIVAA